MNFSEKSSDLETGVILVLGWVKTGNVYNYIKFLYLVCTHTDVYILWANPDLLKLCALPNIPKCHFLQGDPCPDFWSLSIWSLKKVGLKKYGHVFTPSNRNHRLMCKCDKWTYMVADMEVDVVADMVTDMVANMVAYLLLGTINLKTHTIFQWPYEIAWSVKVVGFWS